MQNKILKVATAFSGIGSLEHALDRIKIPHEIIFACDIDPFVKQSYFANYDIDESRWYNDIHEIKGTKYRGKIDLLMGGSPCQSFSLVGKRNGFADDRGMLIYQFVRLIKEIQPKVFIFENVKAILSNDNGETWKQIQKEFKKLEYNFYPQVMNSKNYGIPQNRERLFVIGFKNKTDFSFPDAISLDSTMQDYLQDNINSKYYLPEKGIEFVTKIKNFEKRYTQINGKIALCQKANQQFNWHGDFIFDQSDIPEKYYLSDKVREYVLSSGTKNFYSKPKIDLEMARPLLQSMHKMHRAGVDNYVTSKGRLRKLTPRECLRLMGFSDGFKIVVSDTQMYKQAGNSIVVNIFIHLLNQIYKIKSCGKNSNKRHALQLT